MLKAHRRSRANIVFTGIAVPVILGALRRQGVKFARQVGALAGSVARQRFALPLVAVNGRGLNIATTL